MKIYPVVAIMLAVLVGCGDAEKEKAAKEAAELLKSESTKLANELQKSESRLDALKNELSKTTLQLQKEKEKTQQLIIANEKLDLENAILNKERKEEVKNAVIFARLEKSKQEQWSKMTERERRTVNTLSESLDKNDFWTLTESEIDFCTGIGFLFLGEKLYEKAEKAKLPGKFMIFEKYNLNAEEKIYIVKNIKDASLARVSVSRYLNAEGSQREIMTIRSNPLTRRIASEIIKDREEKFGKM